MNDLFFSELLGILYLVVLGLAPSLIWLWYFLKEDDHPEPRRMIMKVFIAGFVATFVAFALEWAVLTFVSDTGLACLNCTYLMPQLVDIEKGPSFPLIALFGILATMAFIEEFVKYEAARTRIIHSSDFDEPIDAMIYLIVAALGFAAAENIAYVFQNPALALELMYFRFLSATFLHVLASAIIGYFFALSLIRHRYRVKFVTIGFALAVSLHTAFNFLIMVSGRQNDALLLLAIIMLGAFFFVSVLFRRIKKLTFQKVTSQLYQEKRINV